MPHYNPYAEPLSNEEAIKASENLQHNYIFKEVVRTICDPPIIGQKVALVSFVPSPEIKKNNLNIQNFGYLKVRGVFDNEIDAKHHAHNLIKNHDSYHHIYHIKVGAFFPLNDKLNDQIELDEVELNTEMRTNISQSVLEKKKQDEAVKQEIEERTKMLKEEENKPEDPLDDYISKRVKFANVKMMYFEYLKRIEECKNILIKTKEEIKKIDENNFEFKNQYFDRYKLAYDKAGIKEDTSGGEGAIQNAFLRFMKEDIILPENLV